MLHNLPMSLTGVIWLYTNLKCNLFSVKAVAAKDNVIKFGETKCWISGKDSTLFGIETVADKLYYTLYLDCFIDCKAPCCCCSIQVGQY